MKVAISEGKLSILQTVPDKDSPTGFSAFRTETIIDSFLITTTAEIAPEEYENRFHFVRSRDDRKQSELETAFDLENVTRPSWKRIRINENGKELVKRAFEQLENETKDVEAVIPYAKQLKEVFDYNKPSVRRNVKKFLKMIGTMAKLHYHQRPTITGPNVEENVIALPEDLRMLISIGEKALLQTLGLMSKPISDTLLICKKLDEQGVDITTRSVFDAFLANETSVSGPTIYKRLQTLERRGFLTRQETKTEHNTIYYDYIHTRTELPSFDKITNSEFLNKCEMGIRNFLNSLGKTVSLKEYRVFVDPITGERENVSYTSNITNDKTDTSFDKTVLRSEPTHGLGMEKLPEQKTVLRSEYPNQCKHSLNLLSGKIFKLAWMGEVP